MDQSQIGSTGENFNAGIFQFPENAQNPETSSTQSTVNGQAIGGAAINGIFSAPEALANQVPSVGRPEVQSVNTGFSYETTPFEAGPTQAATEAMNAPMQPTMPEMPPSTPEMIMNNPEMITSQPAIFQPLSVDGSTEGKHQKTTLELSGEIIDKKSEKHLRDAISDLGKKPYELANYRDEAMAESLRSNFGRIFGNDDIGEIQAEEAAREAKAA